VSLPVADRVIAAMLDTVNSIDRIYRSYLVQLPAEAAASRDGGAAPAYRQFGCVVADGGIAGSCIGACTGNNCVNRCTGTDG